VCVSGILNVLEAIPVKRPVRLHDIYVGRHLEQSHHLIAVLTTARQFEWSLLVSRAFEHGCHRTGLPLVRTLRGDRCPYDADYEPTESGPGSRFINIDRPIDEPIRSLTDRSVKTKG